MRPAGGSTWLRQQYWRANLDGSELEALTPNLGVDVRGIALDIAGGSDKVYWTVYWPDDEQKIQRANLDGSDVETVLIPSGNPWGIALDSADGKMYWTGWGIWRANLGWVQRRTSRR